MERRRAREAQAVFSKILSVTAAAARMVITLVQGRFAATRKSGPEFVAASVWAEVCSMLKNPQQLEQEYQEKRSDDGSLENPEILKARLGKLQPGVERLIDSCSEGVIDRSRSCPG